MASRETVIYKQNYLSPLGKMVLLASEQGLLGAYFENQKYFLRGYETKAIVEAENSHLLAAMEWQDAYFSGKCPLPSHLSLAPSGTDFQKKVWQALLAIPYGETISYGELACHLSCSSAQAVGGAVGKNPLSLIIPCHRVLGAKGQLTGYAGGLERKIWLLEHENNNIRKEECDVNFL